MSFTLDEPLDRVDRDGDDTGNRRAQDVAALLHFSTYIAREATRLGLPVAAERARMIEQDLLLSLVCPTELKDNAK
jgi:hypothetical protein